MTYLWKTGRICRIELNLQLQPQFRQTVKQLLDSGSMNLTKMRLLSQHSIPMRHPPPLPVTTSAWTKGSQA